MIVNNVTGLAKVAKAFKVPVILTTVVEARGGKIIKGLQEVFPDQKPVDRTYINAWQDKRHCGPRERNRPQEADLGRALDRDVRSDAHYSRTR